MSDERGEREGIAGGRFRKCMQARFYWWVGLHCDFVVGRSFLPIKTLVSGCGATARRFRGQTHRSTALVNLTFKGVISAPNLKCKMPNTWMQALKVWQVAGIIVALLSH